MHYIDTNVILSYLGTLDSNHSKAMAVITETDQMVTSSVAALEIRSVLSRTTKLKEEEIEAYLLYASEKKIEFHDLDMNEVLREASKISYAVKMKTLDLLHVASCLLLRADAIISFDREFAEKRKQLLDLGITVRPEIA